MRTGGRAAGAGGGSASLEAAATIALDMSAGGACVAPSDTPSSGGDPAASRAALSGLGSASAEALTDALS